ncbi:2,3-bisphosphoglycerate-independent phosphoglycerate mutase [Piscirickettsia salmonis]|uniref:2,3-bisphosphoglycerate-independent phosphoglycerate mutase n=1 Tax=Piscirickettsia salmonis TaxID=1238 RepID=UPI0012BAB5C7|nr:2,3-bisphosphoglycerate-independent phosphoglycerate mutase [Piscirickettsia salmonis]QGP52668.1 2,3-bisphosphoglycerate-independent phosphoglycerate mutase [Piscirickettsia salmonis]QGP57522.1 2,3-bisphosphoglycerate-independent phosphoglycerate mutase [Piscirickettsia salmonis]QGP62236.1 2,3-bisphosphoglycerate-independent phosphoglycerate mutase [Piscirickettsia salmonis]
MKKTVVLLVLDGWGHSTDTNSNAILNANTPVWDHLTATYPMTLISASGTDVGLPAGQMGNSEVGHLNLGAGRVVYQDLLRIGCDIESGAFFDNKTLTEAVDTAVNQDAAVHIMGLLSPGGVHSHEDHIEAMIDLAVQRGAEKIYLHAFLDGRDTAPKSAESSLARFEEKFVKSGKGRIASIIGRYYAMDRDQRWERIEAAYQLITEGKAEHQAKSAVDALQAAYARGERDEFVQATCIGEAVALNNNDALIFMNFRADRARQLSQVFSDERFTGFTRMAHPKLSVFVNLTEYATSINAQVAYPSLTLNNVLGEVLAKAGKKQLRIAETEKYAHVTFFFNGGIEEVFAGEERVLIASPKVATYDLQPQMSAQELTDKLVAAIASQDFDAIICNYANADMVGHTGDYAAAVQAIEALDHCLSQVVAAGQQVAADILVTADHGNAELMENPQTGQPHTAHTSNLVPLVYIGKDATLTKEGGTLSDIAPTILQLLGLSVPAEMTGESVVHLK